MLFYLERGVVAQERPRMTVWSIAKAEQPTATGIPTVTGHHTIRDSTQHVCMLYVYIQMSQLFHSAVSCINPLKTKRICFI
jgi:hypothetical protein